MTDIVSKLKEQLSEVESNGKKTEKELQNKIKQLEHDLGQAKDAAHH